MVYGSILTPSNNEREQFNIKTQFKRLLKRYKLLAPSHLANFLRPFLAKWRCLPKLVTIRHLQYLHYLQ